VTLYAFWFLHNQEGDHPFITFTDFRNDPRLLVSLSSGDRDPESVLRESLDQAVQRGTLLQQNLSERPGEQTLYFLNSPRGRAALQSYRQGNWEYIKEPHVSPTLEAERINIFRLYEENIGPLSPIIADTLKEAETLYPYTWIREAFKIAVENNVRRWRYIEAILKSWQEGGRDGTRQKHTEQDHLRYIKGEFGEFGEY
jgi:DnaD/phage-associated family protein